MGRGKVIGTLTFGTRSRPSFTDGELGLMRTVTDQVAIAMERMQLLEAERRRAAELEAVNKDLEAFSYTVSHDLRAPLRSIEGFTKAIIEDYAGKLDEGARGYFNRVVAASQRMSQLIDALLSLSRLTRGELLEKTVDLSSEADVICHELRKGEPDRKAEFVIAKGIKAKGDAALLHIVLENLLDNAWKFTSKHETARIEFGTTPHPTSPLRGEDKGEGRSSSIVYFVRDNGAGFDMAYADKLFKPFKRLHTESEFPGLGMGLATVERIIRRHGGRIWAESAPEQGATFYFTL
jgi:light-regulated signal transduction histidine kinase (bacteriophytochrome)